MTDRMRVALVIDRLDPFAGGLEAWTVQLAEHLLAAGHAVEVLTFVEGRHGLPISVHVLPPARTLAARAAAIERYLATLPRCVVHDTGTGWSGDVFHPQTGSRLLSLDRETATLPKPRRLASMLSPRRQRWRWHLAALERRQIDRARRVIAVSRQVRAHLAAGHGIAEHDIAVISNGVDTARFAPERLSKLRAEARGRLGTGKATLFVMAAHNLRLKGVDTALLALRALVSEGLDAKLAIAGGAPDAGWLSMVERLGLRAQVAWLGRVDRMEPIFAAADAFVHPTRWDACSLSTIEAGAAGLPVITTKANGAAELISDGQTGFVLPDPEDAAALAAAMRMLLDLGMRRRIGEAARAASRGHDIRDNLAAVEAVLASVSAACQ